MTRDSRRYSSLAWLLAYGLIGLSIYFLLLSVTYMASDEPHVAASLLSALIGFILLSAGSSIARTIILARTRGEE